jgi:AmmeMemoRadiSam system radical SAM enzyme/AmmeMemoRadiSam system protein B/AmmeMemoRadiSam system protein A
MKTTIANESLAEQLDRRTMPAARELMKRAGDRIRCLACGHRCLIGDGQRGICKVRFNDGGRLKVPFGYVAGLQCDPVEKKPFFHVYPSSDALTFGMMGCDLHCSYCQNWVTSQALRDASAVAPIRPVSASELVQLAQQEGARLVVSSYNEPLITAEWGVAVFKEAMAAGIACAFVSNGNATPEVLDFLKPWIVSYKIDLKTFNDHNYRKLGGTLENITSTVRMVHERDLWLEVVTLVIPGFNDSDDELKQVADFLVSVSPNIPWHVTAFHKDYHMTDPEPTSPDTLMRACEIGTAAGLRFVYAGNLPGQVGSWEDTRCPFCQATLIERYGYLVRSYRLDAHGCCPECGNTMPGIWPRTPAEVKTGNDQFAYQQRLPRRVPLPAFEIVADQEFRIADRELRGTTDEGRIGSEVIADPSSAILDPQSAILDPQSAIPDPRGRPEFSPEMKSQLAAVAGGMLRSLVSGGAASFPDELAEIGGQIVSGAFVSLKRGRHLRSCCGLIGQTVPLRHALEHAAERTIWEDERFPPVSPTELEHLHMEVWVLFNPEPVLARGEERLRAVTIGKHGIKIVQGQASGLFLPSVAVENEWDALKFLERVCAKAGLPSGAWKEDSATLFTFEGLVVKSSLAELSNGETMPCPYGPCRPEDMDDLAERCRANLTALMLGAVPPYFIGAADGTVNGLVLDLRHHQVQEPPTFSQFSLRPGLPLQATLFSLVQSAAQLLASHGVSPETLDSWHIGVTALHDPVLHGSVADPHLAGFDPQQRALLALERNKAGLVFDPARTAEELLESAALQVRPNHPANATIFSLQATTNSPRVQLSTLPHAVRGPAVRPPAVAGTFYEADAEALARTVDRLLEGERKAQVVPAAMVPHAGLKYSGHVAAKVLRNVHIPGTVIVIGPKHTPLGVEWAVAPQQAWAMPGFEVPSDFMLARRLCQAIAGLEMDAAAHRREHAIEVELPFLARLSPASKVVGIAVGQTDLEGCRRFARGLAEVMRGLKEQPLLLISSDMNHFANDAETRRLDALALSALEHGEPVELYETVTTNNISMCGVLPAVIVLETLRILNKSNRGKQIAYATTADVTGDPSRVVGYAGMVFGG